jgi:hypothetical protein
VFFALLPFWGVAMGLWLGPVTFRDSIREPDESVTEAAIGVIFGTVAAGTMQGGAVVLEIIGVGPGELDSVQLSLLVVVALVRLVVI